MTAIATQLPPPVSQFVRAFDARRKALVVVRAAGVATLLTLAWAMALCLLDRVIALPPSVRLAALILNIAVAVAIV